MNHTCRTSIRTPMLLLALAAGASLAQVPPPGSGQAPSQRPGQAAPTGPNTWFAPPGTSIGINRATGAVSFHFNDLAPGAYSVRVVYDGDANHTGARSALFQLTVGPTITTLTALPATLNSGATLTLTATVTSVLSNKLVTSGTVLFFADGGANPIATVSISATSTHTAVFAFAAGTAGVHSYTAEFVANSSLGSSLSLSKLVTVA